MRCSAIVAGVTSVSNFTQMTHARRPHLTLRIVYHRLLYDTCLVLCSQFFRAGIRPKDTERVQCVPIIVSNDSLQPSLHEGEIHATVGIAFNRAGSRPGSAYGSFSQEKDGMWCEETPLRLLTCGRMHDVTATSASVSFYHRLLFFHCPIDMNSTNDIAAGPQRGSARA
jgi:hypothetical protein